MPCRYCYGTISFPRQTVLCNSIYYHLVILISAFFIVLPSHLLI